MKNGIVVSAILLQFVAASSFAQINLSSMDVASSDSLQRCKIRHFSPGNSGLKKVWNLSGKLSSNRSDKVLITKDSTDIVSVSMPSCILYYHTAPDSIVLIGSESALKERKYVRRKPLKVFPLEYNDSIKDSFICEGVYCGNHPFRETGTTFVKVDAVGSIVLTGNDTIQNVKRVHTIDTYSVCMDIDSVALDTARLTQIIDERYEWFVPESQYPLLECGTSTSYLNLEALGTTTFAFCNMTEPMASYYIKEDEDTYEEDASFYEKTQDSDIFHYRIDTSGSIITISYSLDSDASITAILSSYMGMTYRHKEWSESGGQGYFTTIDGNGLRSGTYILYINVNGKIYSEKVFIQ